MAIVVGEKPSHDVTHGTERESKREREREMNAVVGSDGRLRNKFSFYCCYYFTPKLRTRKLSADVTERSRERDRSGEREREREIEKESER